MSSATGLFSGPVNAHHIVFYGLSTCIWCKRTRQFLESLGVQFDYVYVDLLQGQERQDAMAVVRRWNAAQSFPTVVIDGAQAVVGFRGEEIQKLLGL